MRFALTAIDAELSGDQKTWIPSVAFRACRAADTFAIGTPPGPSGRAELACPLGPAVQDAPGGTPGAAPTPLQAHSRHATATMAATSSPRRLTADRRPGGGPGREDNPETRTDEALGRVRPYARGDRQPG